MAPPPGGVWRLAPLLLLIGLHGVGSSDAESEPAALTVYPKADEPAPADGNFTPKACGHGYEEGPGQGCKCHEGWATAGITDTLNFVSGKCTQYQCSSDATCQDLLGVPEATCPVRGWNCYCGWWYAFGSFGTGAEMGGVEMPANSTNSSIGGAKCMGVLYTFSIWASENSYEVLGSLWQVFIPLAILVAPFGRKRGICDHHRPTLWNALRRLGSCQSMCRGECVLSSEYTATSLADDLAWSLYVLDLMVWCYLFWSLLYIIAMFIWSVVLWAMVIIGSVAACCAAMCTGCVMGGGDANIGDCCGDGQCLQCGECGGAGACSCCDCFGGIQAGPVEADVFYWSGPFPVDATWGSGGYGYSDNTDMLRGGGQGGCSWRLACCPLAWLVYVFPLMPENAWGGLVGYIFGTHQRTPAHRLYGGGNPIIEFLGMGWRRRADLHHDRDWRERVFSFVVGEEDRERLVSTPANAGATWMDNGIARRVINVGCSNVVLVERTFDLEEDRCFPSSYEDYEKDTCWICQDSSDEWDLWVSCRHLFCRRCSTQMLSRRMPCPLCRVASSTVLRGAHRPRFLPDPSRDPSPRRPHSLDDPTLREPLLPLTTGTRAGNPSWSPTTDPLERFSTAGELPMSRRSSAGGGATGATRSRESTAPSYIQEATQDEDDAPPPPPPPPPTTTLVLRADGASPVVQGARLQDGGLPLPLDPEPSDQEDEASSPAPLFEPVLCRAGAHRIAGVKRDDALWQCQDAHLVLQLGGSQLLVAVFDGHGPQRQMMAAEVARQVVGREAFRALGSEVWVPKDAEVLLQDMFQLAHSALAQEHIFAQYAGTTATVAILDTNHGALTVGHVGGSRLVVASPDGEVVLTTGDHVIDAESEERILAAGGEVREAEIAGVTARRVYLPGTDYPGTAMSRSLGDLVAHQLGLTHEPEVMAGVRLTSGGCLILATDGVWEHVQPEEAARFCVEQYRAGTENPEDIAQALAELARSRWPADHSDDITALVVVSSPAADSAAAPPEQEWQDAPVTPDADKPQPPTTVEEQEEAANKGGEAAAAGDEAAAAAEGGAAPLGVDVVHAAAMPGFVRLPGFSTSTAGQPYLVRRGSVAEGVAASELEELGLLMDMGMVVSKEKAERLDEFLLAPGSSAAAAAAPKSPRGAAVAARELAPPGPVALPALCRLAGFSTSTAGLALLRRDVG